ncbi:ABC transporter permease [bacterium 1XD21-13]|nr:ABC transporter permease [bacterium 1XD21-13]
MNVTWDPKKALWKASKEYMVIFAILILGIVFSIASPYFLTINNMTNILLQATTLSVVAIGQAMVLLTGQMDLSLGQNVCLTGYIMAYLMNILEWNPWVAILAGLLTACMVGAVNGFLFAYCKIPAFIVTLGMQNICKGAAKLITNATPISRLPDEIAFFGRGYLWDAIPISVLIMLFLYVIIQFVSVKTKIGRQFYAVGGNSEAAFFAGINKKAVYLVAFTLAGLFAGISSVILISRLNSANVTNGNLYEFDAMISCVIGGISMTGGKGKVVSSLFGAVFLILFFNGMTMLNVDPFFQDVLKGMVLIAAIGIDVLRNRQKQA